MLQANASGEREERQRQLTFPLSYEGVPEMTKESLNDRVEPKRVRAGAMPKGLRRVIRASNRKVSGFFLNPKITPCTVA
jgi:hypothetical protein